MSEHDDLMRDPEFGESLEQMRRREGDQVRPEPPLVRAQREGFYRGYDSGLIDGRKQMLETVLHLDTDDPIWELSVDEFLRVLDDHGLFDE